MKFKILLAGALLAVSATSVMAAGPYVGVAGGISMVHDSDVKVTGYTGKATASYDAGVGFNLLGGYNFDGARVEGEFGYKNATMDKLSGSGGTVKLNDTDITIMSYMVNGYYDFKTNSQLTPFVGAGLGIINGEIKSQGSKDSDTVFGYQIAVGAGYNVNKNVVLDLAYRFQGAASDFSKNNVSFSYNSSNLLAGIRYNF
ncbi:MAG TPA: porin family protein [Desulfuromonadales bacterium]|nr:porin family protein [Desulfuromonadales bacterium]